MAFRVLHGPCNAGNQPWGLSRQERLLGVTSDLVCNWQAWPFYPADRHLTPLGKRTWWNVTKRLAWGYTYPFRYHAVHYYFGRSFLCWEDYGGINKLWFRDMRLAKKLGRTIVMTLQGCDVRVSTLSDEAHRYTACRSGNCQYRDKLCPEVLDRQRRSLVQNVLPLLDRVFYLNPDLARFVPLTADFLPYASVDVENSPVFWPNANPKAPIKILHAPTDDGTKGTKYVLAAVETLKQRHANVEFILIKGLPHEEAMRRYREADILIDQLLVGWYGALAVEVMAMGKPVVCFVRESDLHVLPAGMRRDMPIHIANPDTLVGVLEDIIAQRQRWHEWGAAAREYVMRWHNPKAIAGALVKIYKNPATPLDFEAKHVTRAMARAA